MPISIKRIHPLARIPKYKSPGAAGFDLYAVEMVVLPPFDPSSYPQSWDAEDDAIFSGGVDPVLVPLGFKTAIPQGWQVAIRSRFGLAAKGIVVLNSPGTIHSDYRGEWRVILGNLNGSEVVVNAGDRIAQGVLEPVEYGPDAVFKEVNELDETERGEGGLGSTGMQ